ncbi:MAG: repressor LexA [Candidatus Moranbacteria bacterium]|nr:repressor LexA [Candidatus Moranbacteria bacterium]OIQ01892.1 MAG: repressor LexA [Candidatus Moranbacteria bacterium CG2_30_41_165]PIP25367.1 MAG: repressor LexA [Candidatus Moranbacteria bacterium CG23_combo_of_CG06-09_8_20_14_all_41_28]PIV86613.1 MAG: repressor LexA [Candidatus Moranbacteria bacterium CG17_big_fil_post_rev_8_21_14_2_50_41_107]PIW93993.1 MAG: repressor LexA [Candidatus Moranbacteria bacterium CG_4_8_14_3_um_filter_41_13]PIX91922.1 MAG: repressor LexA [Candidatus Moranbact
MQILTQKQKIVLQAIKTYFTENGEMPTVREIKAETSKLGLHLKSLRSFFLYLNALEAKGYIERTSEDRGILLKGVNADSFIQVPVFGASSAGAATMFADQYIEGYMRVSKRLVKDKNVFAVQVSGTSMNKAKVNGKTIQNGDFILVDAEEKQYHNGDRVLVVIDGLATVKTYRSLDGKTIALLPESTDKAHKPIFLTPEDNFVINGKVIDVLKMPR